MFEEVPERRARLLAWLKSGEGSMQRIENLQLPGAVAELGTSLADVKMQDLSNFQSQLVSSASTASHGDIRCGM